MSTSLVEISGRGFWMPDGILELWLRLLALHLKEPGDAERAMSPVYRIRDGWLLASRGYFVGSIPHGLEEAVASAEGREAVVEAIRALLQALGNAPPLLAPAVLNLLGIEGEWTHDLETGALREVGQAFLDLIEGRIGSDASDSSFMPGSRFRSSPTQ